MCGLWSLTTSQPVLPCSGDVQPLQICSVGLGCDPPGAFLDVLGLDSLEVQSSPGVGQVKTIEELCPFLRYRILLGAEFVVQGVSVWVST